MAKYAKYDSRAKKEARYDVHPIWRGIGCFLIILIPLMAYTAAISLRKANESAQWIAVPKDLNAYPDTTKAEKAVPGLAPVWTVVKGIYYPDAILFGIFTILGFGLLSIIYSMMYKVAGPPRYGPYDAPPIKGKKPRKSA